MSKNERKVHKSGESLRTTLVSAFCDQLGIKEGSKLRHTLVGTQYVLEKVE